MIKVIGVRFRTAGKIYFFDPLSFEIKRGDHVIVETARGIEYGTVVSGVHEVEDDKVIQPLKPVLRIANERDNAQELANKEKEREAFKVCLEKIRKHELDMKLIDAEYTFDNNKVLFYFTADGRIDFRELVKDLASVFKTRIELRQIGVRDETKIVGGIGICGRPLCCHSYLSDFIPVSIKMAKEQNLSLNPTKISGVCGRLMCCLKNEEETYEELNRRLPGIGDFVTTEDGLKGEVQSVNVLRQTVKVVVDVNDEKEIRDYEVDKLRFKRRHNKKERLELSKEELRELERLEKEEIQVDSEAQSERRQDRRNEERAESENRFDRRNDNRQNRRFDRRNENKSEETGIAEPAQGEQAVETVQESNGANQSERRPDRRNEERTESENRFDRRNDNRQNRRFDRRNENKAEEPELAENAQGEQAVENAQESNGANQSKRRFDRRNDNRQNRRFDRKNENRAENGDNRQNRRFERRNENKAEGVANAQGEQAAETQQDGNGANLQERRYDKRNDNRYRRNKYGRRDGRKPEKNDN